MLGRPRLPVDFRSRRPPPQTSTTATLLINRVRVTIGSAIEFMLAPPLGHWPHGQRPTTGLGMVLNRWDSATGSDVDTFCHGRQSLYRWGVKLSISKDKPIEMGLEDVTRPRLKTKTPQIYCSLIDQYGPIVNMKVPRPRFLLSWPMAKSTGESTNCGHLGKVPWRQRRRYENPR